MTLRAAAIAVCLTVVLVAAAPGDAQALTRVQANNVALDALEPEDESGSVVLFGLRKPLERGVRVFESGPGPTTPASKTKYVRRGLSLKAITTTKAKPLKRDAWLYWEDLAPGALFEHPSVLLIVDDQTGDVVRKQAMSWWPLIDGARPLFLATRDNYDASKYRVFANTPHPAGFAPRPVVRPPLTSMTTTTAATTAERVDGPPNLKKDCMVTIGDRKDPVFAGDFKLLTKVARELKLDKQDATSAEDLDRKITRAERNGCRDVVIAIAAHGYPKTGANLPTKGGGTVPESDHAQVGIAYDTKDAAGADVVTQELLDAVTLKRIIHKHRRKPKVTFKIVISACFSGRWVDELDNEPTVRFVGTAARGDQYGYGYHDAQQPNGDYWKYDKSSQTNGVQTKTGGTLENHTTNPEHATEFMNGIMRGLDFWAHSDADRDRTGNDLAKGLVVAFNHSGDNDFAAQLGETNPQVLDHTGPGGTSPGDAPSADFTWTPDGPPTHPKVGEIIDFNASGSSDPDGTLQYWNWDYDDGSPISTNSAPYGIHSYSEPGRYRVTLWVEDNDGNAGYLTQDVFVSGPGSKPAVLDDVPCPESEGVVYTATVNIRIPSYAENASAQVVGINCPGSTVSDISYEVVPDNDLPFADPNGYDAWGERKNTLKVTFKISGGPTAAGGTSGATVTASWQ